MTVAGGAQVLNWEEGLTAGKATGQYKETKLIDRHTDTQ